MSGFKGFIDKVDLNVDFRVKSKLDVIFVDSFDSSIDFLLGDF